MKKIFRSIAIVMTILISLLGLTACSNKFSVIYQTTEGGSITGELSQTLGKGGDGAEVTAVADEGYFFVRWDDGYIYQTRQEMDIQKNVTITAVFAPKIRVYKVLMVYVTELSATLTTQDEVEIEVDYLMSETERSICELISFQFSAYINDLMDGLVCFEVDSYFTTVPLTGYVLNPSSTLNPDGSITREYGIAAERISEVAEMIENYDSVMTTFSMNDFQNQLHNSGGAAGKKYAACYLETILKDLLFNDAFESILDISNQRWHGYMEHYIHEFTHTVEGYFWYIPNSGVMEYHLFLAYYNNQGIYGNINHTKLYLLNKTEIDGKMVGIPEWYWEQFRVN